MPIRMWSRTRLVAVGLILLPLLGGAAAGGLGSVVIDLVSRSTAFQTARAAYRDEQADLCRRYLDDGPECVRLLKSNRPFGAP